MKIIFNIIPILLLSTFTSCMRDDYTSNRVISPSEKYYFITTVNQTDKSKEDYAYVILSLFNADGELIVKFNTEAGDFNKWAIGWEEKKDTIIMNSSDIGIYAWRLENNELNEIEVTDNLKRQAEKIKLDKYK